MRLNSRTEFNTLLLSECAMFPGLSRPPRPYFPLVCCRCATATECLKLDGRTGSCGVTSLVNEAHGGALRAMTVVDPVAATLSAWWQHPYPVIIINKSHKV